MSQTPETFKRAVITDELLSMWRAAIEDDLDEKRMESGLHPKIVLALLHEAQEVRKLVSPGYRAIPHDLPDTSAEAFSRGRNEMIDAVREVLNRTEEVRSGKFWAVTCEGVQMCAPFGTEQEANDFANVWNTAYPPEQGFAEFIVEPLLVQP